MKSQPRALLLVMMDIEPEHEDEFNRWYESEHVPERLAIPGFISGRRFRAVEGGPKYLALYELENADVVNSDAYLERLKKAPTEWTLRMRPRFKNMVRNVYVEISNADS